MPEDIEWVDGSDSKQVQITKRDLRPQIRCTYCAQAAVYLVESMRTGDSQFYCGRHLIEKLLVRVQSDLSRWRF